MTWSVTSIAWSRRDTSSASRSVSLVSTHPTRHQTTHQLSRSRTRCRNQNLRTRMPDGLPNIQPVGMSDWLRAVIYAYPGAGKTSLIGSGAEAGFKTLIVRSSMDLIPSRVLKSGAEEYVAVTWEQMNEILTFCQHAHPFPYDIVWWDNISVSQDMLLDDVWEATIAEKPARAFKVNPDTGRFDKPNLSPTSGLDRGEYGRNMERIQQWLRHMVGCNTFHFGVMAHPHEGQHPTNDEGGFLLRPYVQGKMMTE